MSGNFVRDVDEKPRRVCEHSLDIDDGGGRTRSWFGTEGAFRRDVMIAQRLCYVHVGKVHLNWA